MLKNYLKTAWRNIIKNKLSSFVNISGLAVGIAVVLLISLWVDDELSFEKYHKNYDRIVQVMGQLHVGGGVSTDQSLPIPLSAKLRNKFGSDFKQVVSTWTSERTIVYGDKVFSKIGCYAEYGFGEILTLEMLKGTKTALKNAGTILLNESVAKAIFGNADPINKIIKLNNTDPLTVVGIYKDLPQNTQFNNLSFITPIEILFPNGANMNNWHSSSFQIYGLLNATGNADLISAKIKNVFYENSQDATKPALFLFPMRLWHLYEFANGQIVGGRLQFVWLFGIIGIFVLLLACINFMNLSTARSEKRSKEVGIRKAVGSRRMQLIGQFFSESFFVVIVAFIISLLLVELALPWFNEVSGKQMVIVWSNPLVWLLSFAFCFFTGLIAGIYPAFYLSSFEPVKVLKGTFRSGRFAAIPRKILVVVQFTVSVILIIGTLVVFRQIQHAKNRPIGYNRSSLISIPYFLPEQHYNAFRDELLRINAVIGVSASSSPATGIYSSADNLEWKGKDPNRQEMFGTILIDPDFGEVVNWKIKEGRNFSNELASDSTCFLFNEAAIKQMGLKDPLHEMVKWHGKYWKIIGVVKDMVMRSPFDPIVPTVFLMDNKERSFNVINIKLNPSAPASESLNKIEKICKKFEPAAPFNYKFADEEYASKFAAEERVGKLALCFTTLAIFISCLGLFGMASFVAEQRTKEIGIRKVIGASTFSLWKMLSKDFIVLVIISCFIAIPIAYYFLSEWLLQYQYRTELSWWIFAAASLGALMVTMLTVSYQSISAALTNPVKSLRSE